MRSTFLRSIRSLDGERFLSGKLGLLTAAVLFTAWLVWFFAARIPVYAISSDAGVEVGTQAYPVSAKVAGQVMYLRMILGSPVSAGEVLVEMDSRIEETELLEESARHASLVSQIQEIDSEITARTGSMSDERHKGLLAIDEARAQARATAAAAEAAESDYQRSEKLHDSGLISDAQFVKGVSEAREKRGLAEAAGIAVSRLESEHHAAEQAQAATLALLRRERQVLDGQVASSAAVLERLRLIVEHHRIRSPVTGTIGEVMDIGVGGRLTEGQQVGSVVPRGNLKVVARFPAAEAVGRIRPGQRGRLRVDAFPSIQYGTIALRVQGLAAEATDGLVRVELGIAPTASSAIPLQHGLPGTVDIETSHLSPALLILQIAGSARPRPRSGGQNEAGSQP